MIILRGLPGSGKSYLTACDEFASAEICSADDYFCMSGEYNFEKDELKKAHDFCYNTCVEYLHNRKDTVIIDNTNSTLKEYKKYIDAGNCFGYMVIILEIYCANTECAISFNKRCTHKISLNDELIMFNRWETNDNAYLVRPFEIYLDINNKKQLCQSQTLHSWLTENKLYHFSKLRNKTHMVMAIGDQAATFLDIPDTLYEEFCRRYADAVDAEENLYIMEYANRFPKFRFFVDFDYVEAKELTKDELIFYAKELQRVLSSLGHIPDVYISGCVSEHNGKIKSGFHFKFPNCLVTQLEATDIITNYVKSLSENVNICQKKWENIIDTNVYRDNCGIKMIGSKKCRNNIDVGRKHSLMLVLDSEGNEINKQFSTYELVKALSIYDR